ncbi:DUF975 family protein [Odoribacter sp. OttesenSCG-928-J03]|nr:DUF975 family protein [Odoribacter sp. OttesenSCG-928-J03]MDL2283107.1 DUF975 family protein [Odoribacter sp. OttesenSCG-928-G04]
MRTPNSELRAKARQSLSGQWGLGAVSTLIFTLIIGALAGTLLGFIIIAPVLAFGFYTLFLRSYRGADIEVGGIFDGFKNFGNVLATILLAYIYICLWSLLFVIPGIIKTYSYAMTPYILYDNPQLSADEAICQSMEMMHGYKMKLFLLDLSFIGWIFLSVFTFGIGLFWLYPYIYSARASFYEDLKQKAEQELYRR